jgi:hypothetical protein
VRCQCVTFKCDKSVVLARMTFSTVPFGIPKKYVINHILVDILVVCAIMTFAHNNNIFNRPFTLRQNHVLNHIFLTFWICGLSDVFTLPSFVNGTGYCRSLVPKLSVENSCQMITLHSGYKKISFFWWKHTPGQSQVGLLTISVQPAHGVPSQSFNKIKKSLWTRLPPEQIIPSFQNKAFQCK